MYNINKNKTTEQKSKKKFNNTLIEADNRLLLPEGKVGKEGAKLVKGVDCVIMDGN